MILTTSILGSLLVAIDLLKIQVAHADFPQSIEEKIAVEAKLQGADPGVLVVTLKCESGLKHENVYGDHGKAYGIAQFWKGTFDKFKGEAKMPDLDYYNQDDQITLAAWAFAHGKQGSWTCNPIKAVGSP